MHIIKIHKYIFIYLCVCVENLFVKNKTVYLIRRSIIIIWTRAFSFSGITPSKIREKL